MRRLPLTAAVLACVLAGTAPAVSGAASGEGPAGAPADTDRRADPEPRPRHTSDDQPGLLAPVVPRLLRVVPEVLPPVSWDVAPGVRMTRWEERDARGPQRFHLLSIDPQERGVRLDYAGPRTVSATATVPALLARDSAVAGVNGDFFDIGDTGAPLGIGRDRDRGVLHGRRSGWNASFLLTRTGRPVIDDVPLRAAVRRRPGMRITNVNSAAVEPGGIGVYTRAWGRTSGYRVTSGQRRNVRMVVVRGGRVVESRKKLTRGDTIRGTVLVGRGKGARKLATLRRGSHLDLRWWLRGSPRMVISGNRVLVRDGVVEVVDDRVMHPRTALGIDRDTGEVLVLVVDGRQDFSRGATMVELAQSLVDLGADEALNLDGGGSSTMVARRQDGTVGVVNTPSDGHLRQVANALQVTYRRPAG